MRKSFLFLSVAAALVAVACNKSETVVDETRSEIGFKATSFNPTKAGELDGSSFDAKDYAMYVSASQYTANRSEENPLFFTDILFKNSGGAADWHHYASEGSTSADPIYWPIGGARIDFLAYALPIGTKSMIPAPVFNATRAAEDFTVANWDTYANQVDLLYAAANDQSSKQNGAASPYVKMTFDHAQALLIFNVKVDEGSDIKINDISFVTDDYIAARNAELQVNPDASATTAPTPAQISLLTRGTFTVDNLRNNLVASWSGLSSVAGHWKMPNLVAGVSDCNLAAVKANGAVDYGTVLTNTDYKQLGETLLIPVQPAQNFTITYTVGSNTMQYTYNVKRNGWQAGKKYIYNLDIDINEIIITETVNNFEEVSDSVIMD